MKDRLPSASSRRLALLLVVGLLFGVPRPAGCGPGAPPDDRTPLVTTGPSTGTAVRARGGLELAPVRRLIVKEIPSQEGTLWLLEPAPKIDAVAPGEPIKQRHSGSRPRIKRLRPYSMTRPAPTANQPAHPPIRDEREGFESPRLPAAANQDRAFPLPPVISAWPQLPEPPGFSESRESLELDSLPEIVPPARQLKPEPPPAPEGSSLQLEDPRGAEPAETDGGEKPLQSAGDSPSPAARQIPEPLRLREDKPAERSRHLELIAREADVHTRRGFALAGRGAYFSARAEFVMALRMLAQALDAEHQTKLHGRALAAGLTALKEAGDFIPAGSWLEADLDVPGIIAAHRTPVLKQAPTESLTPLAALRCYFTFAQEQLAVAAGGELAGSMALYGLGNLHRAMATKCGSTVRAAMPKAVVCYQAALLVRAENYMASNELGVLLARAGRCEEARVTLERAVSVCRQSAAWHNLAVVYQQLGRTDLARRAYRQCQAIRQAEIAGSGMRPPTSPDRVPWVDPQTFAGSNAAIPAAEQPMPSTGGSPPRTAPQMNPAVTRDMARSPLWDLQDKRN